MKFSILYIKGWGYKKIANYLTEKNVPTPRMVEKERKEAEAAKNKSKDEIKIKASPVWAIPSISGILQNDFYIGTLHQRKYARKNINGSWIQKKTRCLKIIILRL